MNQVTNSGAKPVEPDYPRGLYEDDEIDLRELFGVLWAGRKLIVAITAAAAVVSVVMALSMPNIYKAEALLTSTGEDQGGLAGLASQFGGLASLAGVSLGGGETDQAAVGLEVLKSRQFFAEFIERRDPLVALMAAEGWNRQTGELEIDDSLYSTAEQRWVREAKPPRGAQPSVQEAHEVFLKAFTVSQDKKTGMVTLAVEHYSPVVAQQWVEWLVEDINRTMRDQDINEAERSISYLKQQIEQTNLADLQTVFFELIQKQTERVMLAKVRPEYLFKTIDPAVVPELKAKPKRALICVLGVLLGGMLAVLYTLVRHYAFKPEQPVNP